MKLFRLFILGFWITILCIFTNNSIAQEIGSLYSIEVLTPGGGAFGPSGEVLETGFDNRSLAMGKTTITTSRSSSAIFTNPSVLGTFSKLQFQVGGKLLYGTAENEAVELDEGESYQYGYPIFPSRSYFSVAVPYQFSDSQLKLVFGLGYQRNEGPKEELEIVGQGLEWSETESKLVNTQVTTVVSGRHRGTLSTITPGIAINLQDKYYIGLTISRTLGSIISTQEWKRADELVEIDEELEQSAQFLRIGALGNVTPELSIGLMYRPGFDWELGEMIRKTLRDGELDTDRSDTDYELTIPSMWGLGAEYQVSPEFIIAGEIQSRPYSDFSDSSIIDNGFNFSVGAEYLGSSIPIRFGVFRDAIPFTDDNDTEPLGLVGLTAGLGSAGDSDFSWDASVQYSTWQQANDEGQKYSENLFRANVSVTYRFNSGFGSSDTN